jgi:hypothetical protein
MTQQELTPIPQPPEKPLIGNLFALDRREPIQGLVRLAKLLFDCFEQTTTSLYTSAVRKHIAYRLNSYCAISMSNTLWKCLVRKL